MKKFVLVVRILILLSFFVIPNVTKFTEGRLLLANAIAGVMFITTIALYIVESLIKKGKI
jgi:hypothetical protein